MSQKQETQIAYFKSLKCILNEQPPKLVFLLADIKGEYVSKLNQYGVNLELLRNLKEEEDSLFFINSILFAYYAESIVATVLSAALKRKAKGIPALDEQDEAEQLKHCHAHLNNWINSDIGDEDTVTDQAIHAVCRALLAYYTRLEKSTSKQLPE